MLREKFNNLDVYFSGLSGFDKLLTWFWLSGPFLMLIERSPADAWITLIAVSFIFRSFLLNDFSWFSTFWVRAVFVFWTVALLSAAISSDPFYSLGEAFIWIRFPLFAMATVFLLARDRNLLSLMLAFTAVSVGVLCIILMVEIMVEGFKPRLSWPFGDLISGNYLAKVGLPIAVIAAAFVMPFNYKKSLISILALITILAMTFLTGERVNFLIVSCGALLSFSICNGRWQSRAVYLSFFLFFITSIVLVSPSFLYSSLLNFIQHLPIHTDSNYYRAIAAGWMVFAEFPVLGIGPGNFRFMCAEILGQNPLLDCHNHPHNFYSQLLAETGLLGFLSGSIAVGSVVYYCWSHRLSSKFDPVLKTAWVVPFALFWPIKTNADFFGQWNNSFLWSAVAIALAIAHLRSRER